MAHGEVLYRDLSGYQTPLLYLLGAALWHLWPQPDAFLAFALGTRLATLMGLVALCRACRLSPLLGVGAGAIYVLLPMGFVFDPHFEPNILITLAGVLAVLALTHLSRRRAVVAGAVCGLALLAKLTFAPLAIVLAIYLLRVRRRLLVPFLSMIGGTVTLGVVLGVSYTGMDFIRGAFFGNAGRVLALDNLVVSVQYLWRVEGFTILAAIGGIGLVCASSRHTSGDKASMLLLGCYLVGGLSLLGVALAVGSLAPEMLAGEPAVALCAALALQHAATAWRSHHTGAAIMLRPLVRMAAPLVGLLVIVAQPLALRDDWTAARYATPTPALSCTVHLLRQQMHRNSALPVLVPAYAAFLAHSTLVDGIVDPFNWSLRLRRHDSVALGQAEDVRRRLERRRIALVVLTDDNPLPLAIQHTVRRLYRPWTACPGVRAFRP
jgi:hypothetical protein